MNFFIPKKVLYAGAGIIILGAGIIMGILFGASGESPVSVRGQANKAALVSGVSEFSAPLGTTSASAPRFLAENKSENVAVKVTRVIDGDTIEIEGGERVRLIGIDTPETVDPRKPVQCFGVEASKKNKELLEGKMIRLEKDITDRDKYYRLLRYVWLGDTLVNLEMVKQGFAYSYSYPPDIKYQDQFVAAEKTAREAKLGLWNACPAKTESATSFSQTSSIALPPAGGAVGTAEKNNCVIKGNIGASGEKIYHLPGCGSYLKTTIDQGRGERFFCSESEAQTAGWRRALNCR